MSETFMIILRIVLIALIVKNIASCEDKSGRIGWVTALVMYLAYLNEHLS